MTIARRPIAVLGAVAALGRERKRAAATTGEA